jgi:hypothetical protein
MKLNNVTSQNKWWLINRLLKTGLYKTRQGQEFLSLSKGDLYGENERYFFKHTSEFHSFSEVRLFKKSKILTVSRKITN